MNSIRNYGLSLFAAVLAVGLGSVAVAEASSRLNPLVRPAWTGPEQANPSYIALPMADSPGNEAIDGGQNCQPDITDPLTDLSFGDCFNQNTLMLRLTGDLDGNHPTGSIMGFIENIVTDKLLQARDPDTDAPTDLFENFLDLTLKRFLNADTEATLDYDPNTFLYRPRGIEYLDGDGVTQVGQGGYVPEAFLDRTCVDIPLVGTVCLHMYLFDNDNELGQKFISYDYETSFLQVVPRVNEDVETGYMDLDDQCDNTMGGTEEPCGPKGPGDELAAEWRDDDDGLQIELVLNRVEVDVLFEPPVDWDVEDRRHERSDPDYVPEEDLSNYLKAHGKLLLGQVRLALNLRIAAEYNSSVNPAAINLGFELQNVNFDSSFQFVFQKGPYCNNNLGTTETNFGDVARFNETERPFDNAGAPNFPRLVSDVDPGTGDVLERYFARFHGSWNGAAVPKFYPVDSTNFVDAIVEGDHWYAGGTGTGRARIGAHAVSPYQFEYDADDDIWYNSDNPNNCRRPADACNVNTGSLQNGSLNFNSVSGSCQYPNWSDNQDDSTYAISEQITSIIPYIQGEINVAAEDRFKDRTRGQPGYYLGPTSLLDLGATLAGISFDWPLRPGEDYVFINALLDSDIRGSGTNSFWADAWGVLMPFDFALGVSWNAIPFVRAPSADEFGAVAPGQAGRVYMEDRLDINSGSSCVRNLANITGYVDGVGEIGGVNNSVADDPFLTRTVSLKALTGEGANEEEWGLLTGWGFPNVQGPGVTPLGPVVPTGADTATNSYGVGFALHQNVLSAALYDATLKGLLCLDLDATEQYAPVTEQVLGEATETLLNTSTFELFFPALVNEFPNRPMRMRVIPLLQRYTHSHAELSGEVLDRVNSRYIEDGLDMDGNVDANLTEGQNYLQENASAPYVIVGGPPIDLNLTGQRLWPDVSIVIPNLLVEFYVYGRSESDNNWYRAFAIDMGIVLGLKIDLLNDPTDMSAAGLDDLNGLGYTDTYFPIGCNPEAGQNDPNYCSGGQAPTRRVLRLAGLASPEINAIIEYSELSFGTQQDPLREGIDYDEGAEYDDVGDIFEDHEVLKGAISNLIGLALSVDVSLLTEIGFDPGAFLNLPLELDMPYFGPSYVRANPDGDNLTDTAANPNGFGDYLVGGIGLNIDALSSRYLITQLDYLLDGTTSTAPFGFDDLAMELAPSSSRTNGSLTVPQAVIDGPTKVGAAETVFRFSGYDAKYGEDLKYSWRVDNGIWTPFVSANEARITGLLEGRHTFEVKAMNGDNVVQPVPARYTFVVDSIAPKVRVVGDRSVGKRANFFVEANDWQTKSENLRVAYRLNDGSWSNYGYDKRISLSGLSSGRHTLRVRVADEAGNVGESAFNFSSSNSGFGCSTTSSGAGSLADVLVLLAIPALVLVRRRMLK